MQRYLFNIAAVSGALLLSQSAGALGLGDASVRSFLGDPLEVRIPLTGTKDELASATAKIASPDVYQSKKLMYPGILYGASATVHYRSNGSSYLTVKTSRVAREPYVNLLVEVTWPGGQTIRKYTVLLEAPIPKEASAKR